MALRTNTKEVIVQIDPLSLNAGIIVVEGSLAQTFDLDENAFKPNRKNVPTVIKPYASVIDPEGHLTGFRPITGCQWYEGSPRQDSSNQILDNENYEIIKSGEDKFGLKIKRNVDVEKPLDIFAVFTISDTRRNETVTFERQTTLYSNVYDSRVLNIKMENAPASLTINPLDETANSKDQWLHTLTAQLYSGKKKIDDANAVYLWQIYDKNALKWREPTADEQKVFIFGKGSDGRWNKSINFDARFFHDMGFRCIGCDFKGPKPMVPPIDKCNVSCAVEVEFPDSLEVDFYQFAGGKLDSTISSMVGFRCVISYNKRDIPDNKYDLFRITWMAKSMKPSSVEKEVGHGRELRMVPSTLGFDRGYGIVVYAIVESHYEEALLSSLDKSITSDGKFLTTTIYK